MCDGDGAPWARATKNKETSRIKSGRLTPEEDPMDREMSPRQEGPKLLLTAVMKKGTPICGPRYDLEQDFGIDPNLMPTSPEGAHLTPPSPLDQAPENVWGQQLAEEIARRLKQQREAAVPTATHAEPDMHPQ